MAAGLSDPWRRAPLGYTRSFLLPQLPGCWASAPHNGLVWCNQLVVKLGAAFVAMAQVRNPNM